MSYPFATRYLDQFPKRGTERAARTAAFISGALAAVLTVASLMDPEIFRLEITPDGTVMFWIGILGAVWAFARGRVAEEESVFDPEYAMRNVMEYTHYFPNHWEGRLHSFDVMQEFSELYKLKPVIFLEELFGIITTPLLLLFTLPGCSDLIVDFFREFTVHVDGVGYVCSFAVFNFKKGAEQPTGGAAGDGPTGDIREDYYSTKHGKMAASYYGFLDNYVINPKTGIPGHMPPGVRHQFFPPPAFPPLNSPTLAVDTHGSRPGRGDRDRDRTRMLGPVGQLQAARTPRVGATLAQPSPMASMLLDPHHQPAVLPGFGGRSFHRPRHGRGGFAGDASIIEESTEESRRKSGPRQDGEDDDIYESGGGLGESVWETSPTKALSRENSGVQADEPQGGVLDLIYQFQQAHRAQRPGGAV
jgi:autophagy-related protein 9